MAFRAYMMIFSAGSLKNFMQAAIYVVVVVLQYVRRYFLGSLAYIPGVAVGRHVMKSILCTV